MKAKKYKSWECQQCGGGLKLWFARFFMGMFGFLDWHKRKCNRKIYKSFIQNKDENKKRD